MLLLRDIPKEGYMKNKLIFVADNKKNMVHLLEFILLSKGGYEIKSFSSEKELIKNLRKNPDLLVMGESLAAEDTMNTIKQQIKEMPVIVLSEDEKADNPAYLNNQDCKYIKQADFFIDDLIETVEDVLK